MKKKETKIREKKKVTRQVSKVMSRLCPSTSQPCKGVGLTVDKVQRVWFGGRGGGRPIAGIPPSPLLGICLVGKISLPKMGRKVSGNHLMHARK